MNKMGCFMSMFLFLAFSMDRHALALYGTVSKYDCLTI